MLRVIPDEIKANLTSMGVWGDFVRRRADLRAEGFQGSAGSINEAVMRELADAGRVPESYVEMVKPRGRGRPRKDVAESSVEVIDGSGGDDCDFDPSEHSEASRRDDCRRRKASSARRKGVGGDGLGDFIADAKDFDGRNCSKSAAYEWAFTRQFVDGVRPEDAPSLYAWALYAFFKKSVSAMVDISKQCLSVSIKREDGESGGGEDFDGKAVYDLAAAFAEEAS